MDGHFSWITDGGTSSNGRAELAFWFYSLSLEVVSKWTSIEFYSRWNLSDESRVHTSFALRGAPISFVMESAQTR